MDCIRDRHVINTILRKIVQKEKAAYVISNHIHNEKEQNAMTEKMKTKQAKEIYKLRAIAVEQSFGDIKENKGMRGFLTRGIETVKTEFNLVCAACNLKKIWIELQKKKQQNEECCGMFFYNSPASPQNACFIPPCHF